MAYFVKIGGFASNRSGVGSRGYHIYRRGNQVYTVWGPVEVRPGRRFYWVQTTLHKVFRCSSPEAATRRKQQLIELRSGRKGYSRLGVGARIERHAKSTSSTRRR